MSYLLSQSQFLLTSYFESLQSINTFSYPGILLLLIAYYCSNRHTYATPMFIKKWEKLVFWTIFGGVFRLGQGNPPPLAWKLSQLWPNFSRFPVWGGPITLWIDKILPPHLCSVCFIKFMDSCKANLVLENFAKKLGFGQKMNQIYAVCLI